MGLYPHEISGGMAQRVLICGAVASDPDIIVADEPTTALDVTVQAEVLELLRELSDERGLAMILVTHNLGVVADLCDTVSVMKDGNIVERADVDEIFERPARALHPGAAVLVPQRRTDGGLTMAEPSALQVAATSSSGSPGAGASRPPSSTACPSTWHAGRDPQPGRGVRLGQDHHRPRDPRPGAGHRGTIRFRGETISNVSARPAPQVRHATSRSSSRTRTPRSTRR